MKQPAKKETKGPEKKKKATLRDRVRKHVGDKNDKITDEDIRDANVGDKEVKEEEAEAAEMAKSVKKNKKITPWEILDEEDLRP